MTWLQNIWNDYSLLLAFLSSAAWSSEVSLLFWIDTAQVLSRRYLPCWAAGLLSLAGAVAVWGVDNVIFGEGVISTIVLISFQSLLRSPPLSLSRRKSRHFCRKKSSFFSWTPSHSRRTLSHFSRKKVSILAGKSVPRQTLSLFFEKGLQFHREISSSPETLLPRRKISPFSPENRFFVGWKAGLRILWWWWRGPGVKDV